ncbi:MAG TPA: helix-turn-helix domain-containing protein [Desulfobacterales bacterium]|nr:helix-turn-helix domain-containing protein [Desulfobacterales bacterium]
MKTLEIKIWLLKKQYKQSKIAKDLNVSQTTVHKAIHGKDKNRRVANWLEKHGCPETYLY